MLEREKVCPSAAIATALAVSSGNRISPDGVSPSLPPNERYACNHDGVYAVPRIDLHEVEWIEPDTVDAEISRLVAGSSTTTTTTTTRNNNPRRCCRTSTSSGYSSHSPPLSAGSYSYYASAAPGQGSFRASAQLTTRDQLAGGLAVIHEGEAIPRPIWPSAFASPREFFHVDDGYADYNGMHTCCNCAYAYSYCDWDYGQLSASSAREVLLELSRTLNSVIEGETNMTPEEILHNISLTVAQSIGLKKGGVYEYMYHNSSWLPGAKNSSSLLGSKNSSLPGGKSSSTSGNKASSSKINPVNSKLYGTSRHFYAHNSAWSSRCTCDSSYRFTPRETSVDIGEESGKKDVGSVECPLPESNLSERASVRNGQTAESCRCNCKCGRQARRKQEVTGCHFTDSTKQPMIGLNAEKMQSRSGIAANEPEYTMQLESSDGGSSSEGIVVSPSKGGWDRDVRGFAGDFDFTLDVSRAERLGRAIAKAKRKRQWCRALTALFGLVFFVLSVVVVSLSVTRGRKVFGSM